MRGRGRKRVLRVAATRTAHTRRYTSLPCARLLGGRQTVIRSIEKLGHVRFVVGEDQSTFGRCDVNLYPDAKAALLEPAADAQPTTKRLKELDRPFRETMREDTVSRNTGFGRWR